MKGGAFVETRYETNSLSLLHHPSCTFRARVSPFLSRRDLLAKKIELEVKSIGQTLKISLERVSFPEDLQYVQDLLNAVDEHDAPWV